MVESQQQTTAATEPKVEDVVMKEWKTCDESSEEYLTFVSVMEKLETLCETSFAMFNVIGYQEIGNLPETFTGNLFEAKVRISDSESGNFLQIKVWKPAAESGEAPVLAAYKKDKSESDDFSWEDSDNVPGVEVPGLAPAEP